MRAQDLIQHFHSIGLQTVLELFANIKCSANLTMSDSV